MAKTNIGAAFGLLVRNHLDAVGLALAARVACHLSDMPPGAVRSLDSDLSFSFKSIGLRPAPGYSVAESINLRRASMLIHKTIQPRSPSPANFDVNDNEQYISAAKLANRALPTRPGHYLAGSYWAYSEHNDRVKTRDAWNEAAELLRAGIRVASTTGNSTVSANLFRRWFGNASVDVVNHALGLTLTGLTSQCTGVGYAHRATQGNPLALIETGFAEDGGASDVKPDAAWGTAKAGKASMCLGTNFFSEAQTRGQPNRLHVLDDLSVMEVSRGGAVLHEATHLFARTDDVRLSNIQDGVIFARLHVTQPLTQRAHGSKAYGPKVCHELAQVSGDDAAKNADNYRLFCEDAFTV
ncbi:hypothetical protein [Variovorax atrisoli]|uniref:hypothetical protein n=1 Tax=Variovorax atrisoli TaxID=3394203 RepID=UPI0040402E37